MRQRWSVEKIRSELLVHAKTYGRMPSHHELVSLGQRPLAVAISRGRHGGHYREWAQRLGLDQKGTETHRGLAVQRDAARYLRRRGFSVVEQRTCAPFDLLIDGVVRVDVKSSEFHEYKRPSGSAVRGYFFGINKLAHTCDVFMFCCLRSGRTTKRYFVPARYVTSTTVSVTPHRQRSSLPGRKT